MTSDGRGGSAKFDLIRKGALIENLMKGRRGGGLKKGKNYLTSYMDGPKDNTKTRHSGILLKSFGKAKLKGL